MQYVSQVYDNTVQESFFTLDAPHPGLSQREVNGMLQQLIANIDLRQLANTYFNQVQNWLNLSAIRIQFGSSSLTIGESAVSGNVKTLDLTWQHQVFASVSYSFNRILKLHEASLLHELHRHFKQPLKNALEYEKVKQLATKDYLTSLGNRVSYQETLHRLVCQAKRQPGAFGMLLIDMDNFKAVNDNYGHQEGDQVLIAMANVLQHCLRETDYAFRFGGDEFCCLLPGSRVQENQIVAERIQHAVADDKTLANHSVFCSIGSANYRDQDDEQSLFKRADAALYLAKENGRNCIKAA